MPNRRILLNVNLLGPYCGNVLAILGPCFSYFYNIFASRCLKRFKFSLKSHTWQIEEYWDISMLCSGPYWAKLGPYFGNSYNIFSSGCLKWHKFSLKWHACQPEEYLSMLSYCDHDLTIYVITFL